MQILSFSAGYLDTNAFLCFCPGKREAVLFDAPHGVWLRVRDALLEHNLKLQALVLTHGHWDHTGDAARFMREGVPLLGHAADRILFETPEVMRFMTPSEIPFEPVQLTDTLEDGQILHLAGTTWEVRHVPGHCPGNILCYQAEAGVAVVGDCIFRRSVGRTDLPGGDWDSLTKSILDKVFTLPPNTRLYCGHGEPTTVGEEVRHNPFFAEPES